MKKNLFITSLMILAIPFSGFKNSQSTEKSPKSDIESVTPHFKIYDTKNKKSINFQELIENLVHHKIIFFGEEHNDSIGHILQNEVLTSLYNQNSAVTLSLEMLISDDQLVIDEYLKGVITSKNFDKDVQLWNNYKDYKPMVEFAKEKNLAVIAANAPTRYTNLVSREGLDGLKKLSTEALQYIAPLPIDTLTGRYYEKFMGLLGGHGAMNSKIYHSQNVWDATMAHFINEHHKQHPQNRILHLCGHFHSDEHLGTVAQLKKRNPELDILVISSFSADDFENPDWDQHKALGDFIILTDPSIPRSF